MSEPRGQGVTISVFFLSCLFLWWFYRLPVTCFTVHIAPHGDQRDAVNLLDFVSCWASVWWSDTAVAQRQCHSQLLFGQNETACSGPVLTLSCLLLLVQFSGHHSWLFILSSLPLCCFDLADFLPIHSIGRHAVVFLFTKSDVTTYITVDIVWNFPKGRLHGKH